MKYLKLFENWSVNEDANTDLELKSISKNIFSILKKYGLNPNYFSDNVKLDKSNNSALIIKDGILTINIWAFAIKDKIKDLGSEIAKTIGPEFEQKSGEYFINNDKVYKMIIRKK